MKAFFSQLPDSRVKQASLDYIPPAPEAAWTEESQATESTTATESMPTADPTLANAALTELQDSPLDTQAATNGFSSATPQPDETASVPSQTVVSNGAANAAAQANWDGQVPVSMVASTTADGWVDVEVPQKSPPATLQSLNSWAEDVPVSGPAPADDESEPN